MSLCTSIESCWQDARYGLRLLRSSPGFALVAILTLALGIGATTAIFSVINAVLLRPLPFADAASLVLLWNREYNEQNDRSQLSFTDIDDYRTHTSAFEQVAAFGDWSAVFSGGGQVPERIPGMLVSDGYFDLMRGRPLLGRVFRPEDQVDGQDYVLVLGYGMWQRRFGGDPRIVGKTVTVASRPYTVIGVMGPDFNFLPRTLVSDGPQFWRPVAEKHDDTERNSRHLRAIARLKPAATLEQAQSELDLEQTQLARHFPKEYSSTGIRVVRLQDDVTGNLRPALAVLFGAVGFLLLIACANVANLLLARSTTRRREAAIRSALGAGQLRLIRQSLTESLLLAFGGGLAGILLAYWSMALVRVVGSSVIPELARVRIDVGVLLFTAGVSLLTSLFFGVAPALQLARLSANEALKQGERGNSSFAAGRLRRALAICEVALALVLLACAGLLLRTFGKLQDVDLGFDSHNVLTMQLGLPSARYPFASEKPMIFYRNLLSRVAQLPGVEDAGAVSILPLGGDFDTTGIGVEGHNYAPGKEPSPERYIVTPGYFRALRIGLLRGRFFTDQDDTKIPVALVNSTAAARFWPGQDALGKHIAVVTDKNVRTTCVVVGVVNDVKQAGLNAPRSMQIYLPHALARNDNLTLTIRTASDPLALAASVRSQVLALDPELAISNVATLDQVLDNSIASQRFSTQLLGAFAALGLLLASIGVYGTLSYSVAQRTREIGIRVALGAARHDVLRLVLWNALTLVIAGVAAGLVGALVAARLLSGMVFGITTHDAATFIMTPVVLVAVALVACYVPAHRALRIDPVVALRYE